MDEARDAAPDLDLDPSFFLEEWDRVVLPQELADETAYLKAPRKGRGVRLGRQQRRMAWRIFERYRELLAERSLTERQEAVRQARERLEASPEGAPYRAVLADEAQDFSAVELRLLRALSPPGANDLFLVGDGHQRIYGQPVPMSRCGIEIRGRSKRLRLNYRTTDAIARQGLAILRDCQVDDLDAGVDTLGGYTSLRRGTAPIVRMFGDERAEGEFVVETIRGWLAHGVDPASICLSVRTGPALDRRYRPLLEDAGISTATLSREAEPDGDGVRLATMHRMKGLEFPRVLLASVHEGMVPLPLRGLTDPTILAEHELQERCLLYVACTRARDALAVCGYGKSSPAVQQ